MCEGLFIECRSLGFAMRASLVVMCLFVPSYTVLASSGPEAVVKVDAANLGTLVKGRVIDHLFEVFNDGDAPLLLTDARSSCGCTVLDYDREIAPGKSGFVRARIDTRTVTGPLQTDVSVSTNDPEHPVLSFVLEIAVESKIGVFPPRARWNTVETETEGEIGVTLYALDGQPFEVSAVEVSNPDISAVFREATSEERVARREGSQWRLILRLSGSPTIGSVEGYATVKTNHSEQKSVFVPVSGFVRPLIFVDPESGNLGPIALALEERRVRYQVRNFGSAPMKVKRAEVVGIEGARVSIEELTQGFVFNIRVHFAPAEVAAGVFVGRVVLHTNLAERPKIEIPLNGELVFRPSDGTVDE